MSQWLFVLPVAGCDTSQSLHYSKWNSDTGRHLFILSLDIGRSCLVYTGFFLQSWSVSEVVRGQTMTTSSFGCRNAKLVCMGV